MTQLLIILLVWRLLPDTAFNLPSVKSCPIWDRFYWVYIIGWIVKRLDVCCYWGRILLCGSDMRLVYDSDLYEIHEWFDHGLKRTLQGSLGGWIRMLELMLYCKHLGYGLLVSVATTCWGFIWDYFIWIFYFGGEYMYIILCMGTI